jgi:aryl-alcohol dehydrogenase-like predicted oxidoreductase
MLAYLIDGVDMEYRTLGRSGLRISRLSLGAMTFGAGSGIWGEIAGLDRAQAARLVAVAAEQGINFIDTADAYSQGKSEEVVSDGAAWPLSRRSRAATRNTEPGE